MGNKKDLSGIKFGRLTVIERCGIKKEGNAYRYVWRCLCDCGGTKEVTTKDLTRGLVRSCGCLHRENSSKICKKVRTKHGLTFGSEIEKRLYNIWKGIRMRCYGKTSEAYKNYGGRGISMCKEWKDDPECFVRWCLGNGYVEGLDIDRIDVNGNYEPGNCRFITRGENAKNRRCVHHITVDGEIHTCSEWGRIIGYSHSSVSRILRREGEDKTISIIRKRISNLKKCV